jgi:hypothetical protein
MSADRLPDAGGGPGPAVREAVALFSQRSAIEAAINDLLAADFDHGDLSVLGSHQSIEAAGKPGKPFADVLTALEGEVKYIGPLTAAGFIALASGPVGAVLAGLIAAGVGAAALKQVLDEVMSAPHTEDFARALEAGSVILWVRVADERAEAEAKAILTRHGGGNIHVNERAPGPGP